MFWVWVKVLFFRQVYGLKGRWVMFVSTLVYTCLVVVILPIARQAENVEPYTPRPTRPTTPSTSPGPGPGRGPGPSPGPGTDGRSGIVQFAKTDSALWNPLMIIATPGDPKTRRLITDTYRILESESHNYSLFNVHASFMENPQQMLRTLRRSVWPSVGVEFQNVSKAKLEYTLHPPIAIRKLSISSGLPTIQVESNPAVAGVTDEELSPGMLQLQAAIDSAYIQTYFPDTKNLLIRPFPDFDEEEGVGDRNEDGGGREDTPVEKIRLSSVAFYLSMSLMLLMIMMATYIMRDKASGVRELLCINGMPRLMVSLGWIVFFMVIALFVALLQFYLLVIPADNPSVSHISYPLLILFLIVFGWTALAFSSFMAGLFSSQVVTILTIILYWMVSCIIALTYLFFEDALYSSYAAQCFISIVPNVGFCMIWRVLVEFTRSETDLTVGSLFTPLGNYTSAGMVFLMMIVSVVLFFALSFYLDLVKPGPYGRARPWHLFTPNEKKDESPSDDAVSVQDSQMFEGINANVPIGLKCVNIVKIFGTFKALNNVNLDVIKNKVTVLLGHNGAGKTTLFSILSGMFSPTSGKVYTDEYSVFEADNLKKFRRVLGYCPQENMVLNELSAQEHLIVFGMLKGLTKSEALEFSDKWTDMFGMYDVRRTQAKNLSGGTKRKLCLAIAMTGRPQYLLLDEPSAGMDIESTRKMWNVLLEQKGKCTVVITTHNMDEAELLGDNVAILAHGQIKCLGSSTFLKKALDSGYRLNCAVAKKGTTEKVIKSVDRQIPGALVLYKTNRSVTLSLPPNQINNIPELLRNLEKEFGDGVSSTLAPDTLDDVFVKIQKESGVKVYVEELPVTKQEDMKRSCCNFVELFHRRVKWMMSSKMVGMLIMVILLPNLVMIGGISTVYNILEKDEVTKALYDPMESPGKTVLFSNHHDAVSDRLRSTLSVRGINVRETRGDMIAALRDIARTKFEYRSNLLFALDAADSDHLTVYFGKNRDRAVAVGYSALVNALLQGKAVVVTHNAPFSNYYPALKAPHSRIQFSGLLCPTFRMNAVANIFFILVGPFFLVSCAYFVVFPHEERTTLFKHLQLMTGLLPLCYWLVNLLFDFALYLCCCILTVIVFACMNHKVEIFLQPTTLSAFVLTLVLYGLSSIFLSYIWSFFFRSSTVSITAVILSSLLLSIGFAILSSQEKLQYEYSYFIPYTVLWNCFYKTLIWSFYKRDCTVCSSPPGCNYVKKTPLFEDLRMDFIALASQTVVYLLIILFLDHGLGRRLMGTVQRIVRGKVGSRKDVVDPEVGLEKQRVAELRSKGHDEQPAFVVDGLAKKYSSRKTAVHNVTFTAERGECFGLVGVNGAGKTTTFGMLAALLPPTQGTAMIEGRWKVTGCNYEYLKRIGYCPQYEGLLKDLSARTIIKLFARLGGVPKDQIGPLAEKWIQALEMDGIAHRPCGHYSGGNKRKLSLAMALIGNPNVVLLDEPTAGVDPVVRRKVWEILTTSLEQHGRTIILTSHTMSECEAVCDRLTIMVKGVMKCVGSIPMLKKTFGKSCILEIKFAANSGLKEQNAIQAKILNQFSGYITVHDTQPTRMVFLLKTENVKTQDMFAAMLRIQSENPLIEDFILSETPLEEVFLMFAQKK